MSKPKILVTGASGQVGSELRVLAPGYDDFDFVFASRQDFCIEQFELVDRYLEGLKPAYCINCAAYTAVDKAESEQELAFLVNGEAVGSLAAACTRAGTKLIHISTDYVFNGQSAVPYREDDPVDPVNVYGASKLRGEQLAMQHAPDAVIIRTAWVYSAFGNNFVKTMIRLMKERDRISVVNDQAGSPTYAADLALATLQIITSGQWVPGIYHYSHEGEITWHAFAEEIRQQIGSACEVNPIPSSGYPTPAKRPSFSLLNKEKIRSTYNIAIPDWKSGLQRCLLTINRL